ncbi:DUF2335 domain-containing protein [Erysipelotrichaceae bacterium HCN-30851]
MKEENIENPKKGLNMSQEDDSNFLDVDENAPDYIKNANDILEKLKPEEKEAVIQIAEYKFSGPIPHPSILAGYNKIDPGIADRIVKMAEKEQEAVIEHRKSILKLQGRDYLLGAVFLFIIVITTI